MRLKVLEAHKNGEKTAKNVMTQCIFSYERFQFGDKIPKKDLPQPDALDYVIYFVYLMMEALCCVKKTVLNNLSYISIYYELTDIVFNVGMIKDYSDIDEYHYSWLHQILSCYEKFDDKSL